MRAAGGEGLADPLDLHEGVGDPAAARQALGGDGVQPGPETGASASAGVAGGEVQVGLGEVGASGPAGQQGGTSQ